MVVFFLKGFICLCVWIIEFISLVDNNRVSINDKNILYVGMFWYSGLIFIVCVV